MLFIVHYTELQIASLDDNEFDELISTIGTCGQSIECSKIISAECTTICGVKYYLIIAIVKKNGIDIIVNIVVAVQPCGDASIKSYVEFGPLCASKCPRYQHNDVDTYSK